MFTKLMKDFAWDESGQGTVEYAGVLVMAAAIAYAVYLQRATLVGFITTAWNGVNVWLTKMS